MTWVMVWGRFNAERWRRGWQELFDTHTLVHNQRDIKRIVVYVYTQVGTQWKMIAQTGVLQY